MNAKAFSMVLSIWVATIGHALAQPEFRNLDFEMAQVPSMPSTGLPIESALPGWGASAASLPSFGVMYDLFLPDSPQIGIYDDRNSIGPLFGNYSPFLMADIGGWTDSRAELFQTGFIPERTKTLMFATTPEPILQGRGMKAEDWSLSLLINGEKRPYVKIERDSEHVIWGADVSALAGSVVELRFSLDTSMPPGVDDAGVAIGLDAIEFSPTAIPEPALIHLLLLGFSVAYLNNTRCRHNMITAHADLELRSDSPNPRAYCAHVERCKNEILQSSVVGDGPHWRIAGMPRGTGAGNW